MEYISTGILAILYSHPSQRIPFWLNLTIFSHFVQEYLYIAGSRASSISSNSSRQNSIQEDQDLVSAWDFARPFFRFSILTHWLNKSSFPQMRAKTGS